MKRQIAIMFIFGALLLAIPGITLLYKNNAQPTSSAAGGSVKILFTESQKISEISMQEYMVGAVLAQMPADFDDEALKAQAVLAHTYIVRRKMSEKESPDKNLKGADISDDTAIYQSYFTPEQAKEFYGEQYDDAFKNVSEAVKSVQNEVLTYDSQPIIVAFHAVSCGKTESAKNMWGEDIPYLVSVDSNFDKQVEGFEKTTELSADELADKLKAVFEDADFSGMSDEFEITKHTDNGTILSINAGGNELSGTDFATALSLPSPCFSFTENDGIYTFTSKGVGHLVGMSQYGANAMAQKGSDYKQILQHYFPKTKLT